MRLPWLAVMSYDRVAITRSAYVSVARLTEPARGPEALCLLPTLLTHLTEGHVPSRPFRQRISEELSSQPGVDIGQTDPLFLREDVAPSPALPSLENLTHQYRFHPQAQETWSQ